MDSSLLPPSPKRIRLNPPEPEHAPTPLPFLQRDPAGFAYHETTSAAAAALHGDSSNQARGRKLLQEAERDCNPAQGANLGGTLHVEGLALQRKSRRSALNEFLQNLIDEAVSRNDYSYSDLKLKTEQEGDAMQELLCNSTAILAELWQGPKVLNHKRYHVIEFINYGASVSAYDVLTYGHSTKRAVPNQIGTHGTGFKLAVCYILSKGWKVEVEAMVNVDRVDRGGQMWRFKTDSEGNLRISLRRCVLQQRCLKDPFRVDVDRFLLRIMLPVTKNKHFLLSSVLVPFRLQQSRAAVFGAPGSKGCILHTATTGKVWVKHFFVEQLSNCLFSYDFVNLFVGHDRSRAGRHEQELQSCVASVLAKALLDDGEYGMKTRAALFEHLFGFKPNETTSRTASPNTSRLLGSLEFLAFCGPNFPAAAVKRIADMLPVHLVPIKRYKESKDVLQHMKKSPLLLPPELYNKLSTHVQTLRGFMRQWEQRIIQEYDSSQERPVGGSEKFAVLRAVSAEKLGVSRINFVWLAPGERSPFPFVKRPGDRTVFCVFSNFQSLEQPVTDDVLRHILIGMICGGFHFTDEDSFDLPSVLHSCITLLQQRLEPSPFNDNELDLGPEFCGPTVRLLEWFPLSVPSAELSLCIVDKHYISKEELALVHNFSL